MTAKGPNETLTFIYQTTPRHIPQYRNLDPKHHLATYLSLVSWQARDEHRAHLHSPVTKEIPN
jgi:hypothetical protein